MDKPRPSKTIYQLDSPFTSIPWPEISAPDQNTVLELLVRLLAPIGQHRTSHVNTSEGKRSKKRKRKEEKAGKETQADAAPPPPPEISFFVTIGLNTIIRTLESSSRRARPGQIRTSDGGDHHNPGPGSLVPKPPQIPIESQPANPSLSPYFSAIFVLRSSQPTILHAHLPQLISTASLAYPDHLPPRLVQLPKGCDERIGEALGLPRASFIGLVEGAPHSEALVDLIRQCVEPIEIPWVKETKYLPVKINAIDTKVGESKKARSSRTTD